jgi:hypothetical protein
LLVSGLNDLFRLAAKSPGHQALLQSRSCAIVEIAYAMLEHHSWFKELLLGQVTVPMLKLKLALYKMIQKLARSLLGKELLLILQQELVAELAKRLTIETNLILNTLLMHALAESKESVKRT